MSHQIVIMGVAGCGKSSLAALVAQTQGLSLIEGDDFHSADSRAKMSQGIALTDADRAGWLDRLGDELRAAPQGLVLTCSALKLSYRERLRAASPGLRFVFLDITRAEAERRVATRSEHFFSSSLVDSQFATLQAPLGEAGVLRLDASLPLEQLRAQARAWLQPGEAA